MRALIMFMEVQFFLVALIGRGRFLGGGNRAFAGVAAEGDCEGSRDWVRVAAVFFL